MTNILQFRRPPVLIRKSGHDWLVRVVESGQVSEQLFDNLSCAERVADAARKRLVNYQASVSSATRH